MSDRLPPYFLGLDASTQAVKASLLTTNLDVVSEVAVNFDQDLPSYKTKNGVQYGPEGSGEVYSPVMMVVEAMDILFEKIKAKNWNVKEIRGVSAAGQQHASVYWSKESRELLSSLDPSKPLAGQLDGAFSRPIMPNWQDSSTTRECREIEQAVGGPEILASITGSRAHERFTGPQIMRFKRIDPEGYENTDRISLCSSFITTLLCADGEVRGIDESDACGMNLWTMNRPERGWSEQVMEVIAGSEGVAELERKLGEVETDGGRSQGNIGKWFIERYGFDPSCCVFPGTGDNPATFLSLTLRPSEGLVSLGTSDVVLVPTSTYNPHQEYHAFFHPAQIAPSAQSSNTNGHSGSSHGSKELRYFNMLVYKNGSLARQHVRDLYFDKSWDKFNDAVNARRPEMTLDLPQATAFWWLLPEIIPDNAFGTYKYTSKRAGGALDQNPLAATSVDQFPDVQTEAVAVLESQFLNYRSRSSAILGSSDTPFEASSPGVPRSYPRFNRVYATGGASANRTILSLMADVLSAPICANVEFDPKTRKWSDANWNACSVGGAYKAKWGWERHIGQGDRKWVEFDTVINECREARSNWRGDRGGDEELEEEGVRAVAYPGPGSGAYERSVAWWQSLEKRAVEESRLKRAAEA